MKLLGILGFWLLLGSAAWAGGPSYPPPPVAAPDCAGGASVTGYPSPGSPLGAGGHCGAGVSTGTINTSTVGQAAAYTGTGTVTGYTPGGDLTFSSPNYTITGINGVALGSTTATAGNLLVGSGSQWVTHAISGDATLAAGGALTVGKLGGQAVTLAGAFTTSGAFPLTLTQTGSTNVTLPTSGILANQAFASNAAQTATFTLGSTPIVTGGATYSTIAGLTLTSPTINTATIASPTISSPTITNYIPINAQLLGSDSNGKPTTVSLGTGLSLGAGNVLNATGGGGGGTTINWPTAGTLILSPGGTSSTPSGLAPVTNALLYGTNSAWSTLPGVASNILCTNGSSVPSWCGTSTIQGLLGYLTANQNQTFSGDVTGSGATTINLSVIKVNGVNYPASPATSTIPVVTGSNQVTYQTASQVLSTLGAPFAVASGGTGLATQTAGAIYKGAGTSNITPSALSDNGTIVSTTEPIDLTTNSAVIEVANAGTGGTTAGLLAKLSGAPSTALTTLTSDTDGAVGIVIGGGGTTGSAQIAVHGRASCTFDGATTAGHFVTISGTVAGNCHDFGAARPTGAQSIGQVLSTNGAGGSFPVEISVGFSNAAGSAPTWPANGSIVVSNTTNTPAGIAPVNGDCIIGSGGAWVAGACLGGGAVTSSGTSTVNNIPFWTGTGTLSNTGVPYGTTGNNTLPLTLGTGLLSNSIINWAAPSAIGGTTPTGAAFTTLSASGAVTGTGFSTYLASPPAIGGTAPATGAFTSLAASGAVTGAGFTALFASPPSIGSTAAASGAFTTLSATGAVSGAGFNAYLASPPAIGGTVAAAGSFTALSATGTTTLTGLSSGTQVSCLGLNSSNQIVLLTSACGSGSGAADTVTTGIAAAGTTQGTATAAPSQQNYVATGANCAPSTFQGGAGSCAGTAAVIYSGAMTVGGHVFVTNEDPTNALLFYPPSGSAVNLLAANVGFPIAPNTTVRFNIKTSTALRSVP